MDSCDTYTCVVCCENCPASQGIAACWDHFICNSCGDLVFTIALSDIATFLATCCKGQIYQIGLFEHLLDADFMKRYHTRLQEYYTAQEVKVYCFNEPCSAFIPPSSFDNSDYRYSLALCAYCNTMTCVGCKKQWVRGHRCETETDRSTLPEWIPEYTADCRIKRCPKCYVLIEHQEACNHMTCAYCQAEFCFVWLMPWTKGTHYQLGCPALEIHPKDMTGRVTKRFRVGCIGLQA